MKRLTKLSVAVAAAATLTCSPLSAGAEDLGSAGDVRYKRVTAVLEGGPTSSVELFTRCNKGWSQVGGGVTMKGGGTRGIATDSRGAKRYRFSEAWQTHDADTTVTGYAICLKDPAMNTVTKSEFTMPPSGGQITETATCEEGRPISGGVRAIGEATHYTLNSSYPVDDADEGDVPDNGWRVYMQYAGGDDSGILVDVVCLTGAAPAYRSETVVVPAFTTKKLSARCPKAKPVLGGGVYADGAASRSLVMGTRPMDGKDAGKVPEDGWRGTVRNTSDAPVNMTVTAVCR